MLPFPGEANRRICRWTRVQMYIFIKRCCACVAGAFEQVPPPAKEVNWVRERIDPNNRGEMGGGSNSHPPPTTTLTLPT
jgi:hypothetical protein